MALVDGSPDAGCGLLADGDAQDRLAVQAKKALFVPPRHSMLVWVAVAVALVAAAERVKWAVEERVRD